MNFDFIKRLFGAAILVFIIQGIVAAQETSTSGTPAATAGIPPVVQVNELTVKELLKPDGKPLLINFWATWCVPCREEFPDLVKLDKEFAGKIDFITITLDDLAEINRDVPKFLREMNATMPAYLLYTPDENEVIGSISKTWEGGLPFTVLYSESGKVVHTRQGKINPVLVTDLIKKLLDSKKTDPAKSETAREIREN